MKKYILIAAAAISLAACNNDDNYVDEPVAAHISATISQSAVSRASDASWDSGDAIGITMSDRYTNVKYTAEDDGVFSGTTMYFRNKQDQEIITAYYPWNDLIAGATTIDADTRKQAEQKTFDFLYAKLENVTGQNPNVNLEFSHEMSKLTLIFKNGNEGTDVSKITSYTIEGLVHDGTFNPATGTCAAKADTPAEALTITLAAVENEKAVPPLIIFPQAVDKVTLKIKDSEEQDYICDLKFSDNRLESGNNYQFTITVKKTGLSVNSTITDWITEEFDSEAKSDD